MDRELFEKILTEYFEWKMAVLTGSTKPLGPPRKHPLKKIQNEDGDFIDDDDYDLDRYSDAHKPTQYPVVSVKKPVKIDCKFCENEVIDQVFSIKVLSNVCTMKCQNCRKKVEIPTKDLKINK